MKIRNAIMGLLLLSSAVLVSCKKQASNVKSDSLYVKKVDNYKDNFINGMDVSQVISLENSGVKYYNFDGEEEDVLKILSDNGINYIRVRVWNNPYDREGNGFGGGNCTIDTAVELGKRATKYGMKLLVDFHYSDFWADPSKQMCPRAWLGMTIDEKALALYQYTKESLQKLKDANVDVGMVQIGNETNNGLAGETTWYNRTILMKKASEAIREVTPKAKIAVHFANPEKAGSYQNYASKLNYYNLDYDIFASSYYPYWHGSLENLQTVLDEISDTYNKDTLVVETSYAYTTKDTDSFSNTISDGGSVDKPYPYTIQGQASEIRDIIQTVCNMKRGIGVFYWEGAWISVGDNYEENLSKWEQYGSGWASSYSYIYDPEDAGKYYGGSAVDNQAFFDENGKTLESLKVWSLCENGNEVARKADAIEDTNLIFDLNGEISFPTKVKAVMNDGSKEELDVTWENIDINTLKNGGVKKYSFTGTAGGMIANLYISMIEYNYIKNYSFEDGDSNWIINDISKRNEELNVEDKSTDSLTGTKHIHFWSSGTDNVEFSVEQNISNLPNGKYKYSISIMGGDCGDTDIYLYVKVNGKIIAKKALTINGYGNWDTEVTDPFEYTEGAEIVVGIYVKCKGEGNGAWGKIDDALLNSVN